MTLVKNSGRLLPDLLTDFFSDERLLSPTSFISEFSNWLPAVNITENSSSFKIDMAVPGFEKNDFKIELENEVLTVSAEKEEEKKSDDEKFTRREFKSRSFSRSFTLPASTESKDITCNYENGVLKFMIPKKEEVVSNSKKTEIKIA